MNRKQYSKKTQVVIEFIALLLRSGVTVKSENAEVDFIFALDGPVMFSVHDFITGGWNKLRKQPGRAADDFVVMYTPTAKAAAAAVDAYDANIDDLFYYLNEKTIKRLRRLRDKVGRILE